MSTEIRPPEKPHEAELPATPGEAPAKKAKGNPWHWRVPVGIAAIAVCWLILERQASHGRSAGSGGAGDLVTVPVVKVERKDLVRGETFDAEFRPYQVVDLRAEVAGFVKSILVDIGDRVREGDRLATLEVPELTEDIEHAAATVQRNQKLAEEGVANYEDAHVTFTRLDAINQKSPHLVAKQDLDTARAKDAAAAARLAAAQEEVKVAQAALDKLRAIQNDCNIIAPFSGVITKRFADVGAFVQGGISPSGAAMPLVRLSQNDRLRLDFPVSVSYAHRIKAGDPVEIRLTATGQVIHGAVSRFTHNIDMDTRTMETEVDVPNADLSIIPGAYAEARLDFERRTNVLSVPAETLSDLKTPTAFVVTSGDIIEERPLTLGLTTPDKYEILAGLKENELVMIGNRSQVKPGQKVEAKILEAGSPQ